MLQIVVPLGPERWDEEKEEFVQPDAQILQLEHSLLSLSKWESKWKKPFLTDKDKTAEETLDYVRCMTITRNVDPSVYLHLSSENISQIKQYIDDPMTATTISKKNANGKKSREIITAEIIYYWLISLNMQPVSDYEKWHLNRLITLIEVCNIKNTPPKKRSKKDILSNYAKMNEERRRLFNSNG